MVLTVVLSSVVFYGNARHESASGAPTTARVAAVPTPEPVAAVPSADRVAAVPSLAHVDMATIPGDLPGSPVGKAGTPALLQPADGSRLTYRSLPAEVRFAWAGESGDHRFEIARDPGFREVLHEQRLDEPSFVHGNLSAGRHYWRVFGGPAASFEIVHDDEPPFLDVAFPAGVVPEDGVVLRGSAEPGARVFIGDAVVPTSGSGSFEHRLPLERGVKVVVVEAIDPAGNVAYRSRLLTAGY